MKKISSLAGVIIITLIMTACSNDLVNSDAEKFKKDYEALNGVETATKGVYYRNIEIAQDNPIIYTTFKKITEKIKNKETFILYIGFSACPWCRSVTPYIIEEANKNGIDKIYYINLREDNTKESDLRGYYELNEDNHPIYSVYPDKYYHDVLNTLDKFLTAYTLTDKNSKSVETGEKRLFAPSLIVYKNGKAIALDECISDKQKDGYQTLSEDIINDMRGKINNLFNKYKKNKNCNPNEKSCK